MAQRVIAFCHSKLISKNVTQKIRTVTANTANLGTVEKYAVTGVYFFNNSVINEAKKLKPSRRNELEITDLNNLLIKKNKLKIKKLNKFQNWHDAGNHEDYLNTCLNIFRYETKHKTLIGSIEYECYKQGILKRKQIENNSYKNNYYFDSLRSKLDENL